ncbi:phage tail tip protein J-related protein [Escherichia coli]
MKVKVSRVPDGVAGIQRVGLKLPTLRQRLFRCVSIRERRRHVCHHRRAACTEKRPSWITGRTLTATGRHGEWCSAASGAAPDRRSHRRQREYQVLARWDTPKVVKGVSFLLRLTVAADDGSERLVERGPDGGTRIPLQATGAGDSPAGGPGGKCVGGEQGDPASVSFRDCRTGSAS